MAQSYWIGEKWQIKGREHSSPQDLYAFLQNLSETASAQPALAFHLPADAPAPKVAWDFAELWRQVVQTANFLRSLQADENTVVAILLPQIPEAPVAMLAAALSSQAFIMNPYLSDGVLLEQCQQLKPSILISLAASPGVDFADRVEEWRPEMSYLRYYLQVDLADYVGKRKGFMMRMTQFNRGRTARVSGQELGDFNRNRQKHAQDALSFDATAREPRPQFWLSTDGSTESPSLLAFTGRDLLEKCQSLAQGLPAQPMVAAHASGGWQSLVMEQLLPWFQGKALYQAGIQAEALTTLPRPLSEARLNQSPGRLSYQASGYYHASAGGWVGIFTPDQAFHLLPKHHLAIGALDAQDKIQREQAPGLAGEILLQSPTLAHHLPAEDFVSLPGQAGRWYRTGDIGSLSDSGYLRFLGKKAEGWWVEDQWISPPEIEEFLEGQAGISEAAVVRKMEAEAPYPTPVAYLSLEPQGQPDLAAIYQAAQAHFAHPAQVPPLFRLLEELPRTSQGHKRRKWLEVQEASQR
ncbi:MAG: AMP-binding protein [Bacteroidota bacterium]